MVDIGNDLFCIVAKTSELGFLYLMDYFIFLSSQTAEIEYFLKTELSISKLLIYVGQKRALFPVLYT